MTNAPDIFLSYNREDQARATGCLGSELAKCKLWRSGLVAQ
jgi:hypothetical protein